jgi:antitoxin component YwqK of YwqJK toxin-antitoxin module
MYFGSMKQNRYMISRCKYLLLALLLPLYTLSQTNDFVEWQKNYPDLIWNFEKNLDDPLSGALQKIPDHYFSEDTLPDWLYTWNSKADNIVFSVGISDPFLDAEKAYKQAYNRAVFLLSLQIFTVINGMNEYYTRTDEINSERNDAFTQYYQFFSKSNINDSVIQVSEKTVLKTGECIVKLKYPLDASFLKNFNTYISMEWYSQEKSLDLGFETTQKLILTGNTISRNGLSEGCAYTYKRFNDKDEVLSECPENSEYFVPTFSYIHNFKKVTSTQGLWNTLLYNFTKKMVSSSQLSNLTIKNVSDVYQKLDNNLSREIIMRQSEFYVHEIDSNLFVYFYSEPQIDSTIHDSKEGSVVTWYDNGIKKSEFYYTNDLLDGVQREWTSNDKLISEIIYSNGVLNGLYQTWYDNYQPKEYVYYNNGKPFGDHNKWYEDGRLQLQEGYNENGNLEGKYLEVYPDGTLKTKGKYKNGLKRGAWKTIDEKGKSKTELYRKGKKVYG